MRIGAALKETFLGGWRRTAGAPMPVDIAKAVSNGGGPGTTTAQLNAAVKQFKTLNLDPLQSQQMYGDMTPTGLQPWEARMMSRTPLVIPFVTNRVVQWRKAGKRRVGESSFGYEVGTLDPKATLTKTQKSLINEQIIPMLERGQPMAEKMQLFGRDSHEMDIAAGEIVTGKGGLPFMFKTWDGATFRWAVPTSKEQDTGHLPQSWQRVVQQWMQGRCMQTLPREAAIVIIRNPRTDIWVQGYGFSEVEQAAADVAHGLQADAWNGNVFENGFAADFMLKVRAKMGEDEWIAFKEQAQEEFKGLKNAHRVGMMLLSPKMQALQTGEEDIERLDLSRSMKDMEYRWLIAYYYRRLAAAFSTALEEIGMDDPADTGKATLQEADSSWKIALSKEKGLSHGLDVAAEELTRQLIWPYDESLCIRFNGLNSLSPEKQAALDKARTVTMSYNELRREKDLPPFEGEWAENYPGEVGMQIAIGAQRGDQQAQQSQMAQQAQAGAQDQQPQEEPPPEPPDGEDYPPDQDAGADNGDVTSQGEPN